MKNESYTNERFRTVLGCLVLCVVGCKPQADTQAVAPTSASGPQRAPDRESDDEDPNQGTVNISKELADLCKIEIPHFDFDSTKLSKPARTAMNALAQCFIDGPAKGKSMRLVGHADPRGGDDYNFGLGQRRAASVAKYLNGRGLEPSRTETSSRGKLDAKGTDDASYALDRKVEISLAH